MAGFGVALAAGSAQAQRLHPGVVIRPVATVSPLVINPTLLATNNVLNTTTAIVPGRFIPSTWAYSPFVGPVIIPGHFTPATVVRQPVNSGQFLRLPGGQYYNPWTGSSYSAVTNTFNVNGTPYVANPWSGTYTNPWLGSRYNPTTGAVSQAVFNPLGLGLGLIP
ncbi:hypothetical protein FRUB_01539 [Fimbriiglobus ruber]|uniref:Uncharacterized protein n=1 Tax=Fimbriiglobus ruber TaxID=1908690 RepID=A0A225E340_9BACT|nr:hypothetical protein FRUB_01539 [Fimbriiglobus ruber]